MSVDHPTAPVQYRDISEWFGYRVGDDGSAWSFKRGGQWRRLSTHIIKGGYHRATLLRGGKARHFLLHHLVLMAFVGPCPEGLEGCHEDGDPSHNWLGNLRWDTHVSNAVDQIRHGRTTRGTRSYTAKLTEADIPRIREMAAAGMTYRAIGDLYGVTSPTIHRIVVGKGWRHV
jgi:hypothetical protein